MEVKIDYVMQAKAGSKESFALLYDEVATDLYKVALYTLGNTYDAEDVVSETFVEAYKGIKNLRDESKFKPWIMRILSVRCKRKIGQYIQTKKQVNMDDFIETPDDVSPHTADCSDKVTVISAMETLSEQERNIVTMSVLHGYTTKEISVILELPHGTVSSKLYRTLLKLRKLLEQ